jgi:hypothetical protein
MKTLLGFAVVFSAITLVLAPSAEAGRRCGCGGSNGGGYAYAPAATTTAQADSGYRTYSYEPGTSGSSYRSARPVDRSFRDATFKASGRQN